MKIGIISDTHDHLAMCRAALKAFADEGAKTVLHAGDYVAPFVIPEFDKAGVSLIGVFGNNDGEKLFLAQKFREFKFELYPGPYELELEGRRICLMHEPRCLDSLIKLDAGCRKQDLIREMKGHILAEGRLMGRYTKQ